MRMELGEMSYWRPSSTSTSDSVRCNLIGVHLPPIWDAGFDIIARYEPHPGPRAASIDCIRTGGHFAFEPNRACPPSPATASAWKAS